VGDTAVIYRQKLESGLQEAKKHIDRIESAFSALAERYVFPLSAEQFNRLLDSTVDLAFADQIIYRFSKAQDCMGAKLFKAFLLYQGENIDRPFLDILNALEKIDVLKVDVWFELREIRNEISHKYDDTNATSVAILNSIFEHKVQLHQILDCLQHILDH